MKNSVSLEMMVKNPYNCLIFRRRESAPAVCKTKCMRFFVISLYEIFCDLSLYEIFCDLSFCFCFVFPLI